MLELSDISISLIIYVTIFFPNPGFRDIGGFGLYTPKKGLKGPKRGRLDLPPQKAYFKAILDPSL